jgi:hypothetical protein
MLDSIGEKSIVWNIRFATVRSEKTYPRPEKAAKPL